MTEFELDMTMVLATHDALRRDLAQVRQMHERNEGWTIFETMLHLHHTAEDDLLWPVMRDAVAETRLLEHLTHEEHDTLLLVDRTLTVEQWMAVGQAMAQRVGPDMPRYLPWLLDGADQDTTTRVLATMPPLVRQNYADQWRPAFAALDPWATNISVR